MEELPVTHIKENQTIIEFLNDCLKEISNKKQRESYIKAINEIHSYWGIIELDTWKPEKIGIKLKNKIKIFIQSNKSK